MSFDIDVAIFVTFLVMNLAFGLYWGRGVTTIRSYAVGGRNFSTATLVSTIVATWLSGSWFFNIISGSYTKGLNFIWTFSLGDSLCLLLIGCLFAPRMAEFLGKVSIAEAMGDLFGNRVRTITAISGVIGVIGIISVQLKIAGLLFEHALGMNGAYGIIFAGIIVTLYSSLGGVKSVVFTDVVQFATFGVVIPTLAYFLFYSVKSDQSITHIFTSNPLFDYKTVFDFYSPATYCTLLLFLFWTTPGFTPALFQRVAMARNTNQIKRSFVMSSLVCLLLAAAMTWIAILVLTMHPNLDKDDIFKFILADASWIVGFKGVLLAGIMAMVMSTIDSYINSTSVLLTYDLPESLNIRVMKNKLFATRLCSMGIGFTAILLSTVTSGESFIQLFLWAMIFFMPVVTAPFILAVFGFRSSEKSVLLGMCAGFIVALIWELLFKEMSTIDGVIPAMFANLIILFASHYLLKQPGGWVGIKDPAPLLAMAEERRQNFAKFMNDIKTFSLIKFLRKSTPKHDGFIAILGLFIMISNFATIHALPKAVHTDYSFILDILYPATLFLSTGLISYPLWLPTWQMSNFLPYYWHALVFFILVCFNFFTVLITNFAEMQLMAFMVNMVIISCLIQWRSALFMIVTGVLGTLFFYKYFKLPSLEISEAMTTLEFKIVYLLLFVSSSLVIFLKPKQEYLETTEYQVKTLETQTKVLERDVFNFANENYNLASRVRKLDYEVEERSRRAQHQEYEIQRLGATTEKILDNVNHELRLPIGNVMNFAEMLRDGLEKYDKKQLKQLVDEVYKNSTRLSSMILNMLDLATLNVQKVDLRKTLVNLSEIVMDRVSTCRKIYLQDKPIDFELSVQQEVMVAVDPNYMRQMIDNLVINAIKFSEKGLVKVSLTEKDGKINFMIIDQGKGIPQGELADIFQAFKIGSNNESKASGRGVGLALCKAVIEAHGGWIKAESNGISSGGAKFWFELDQCYT